MPTTDVALPDGLGEEWLTAYTDDFRKRMLALMGYEFRRMPCALAYSLVKQSGETQEGDATVAIQASHLENHISVFDLKRLEAYTKNMVDFHLVMDLVPTIAKLYFHQLPKGAFNLSPVQAALITGIGLQFKSIDTLQGELNLQANQLLPMFNKAVKKFTNMTKAAYE